MKRIGMTIGFSLLFSTLSAVYLGRDAALYAIFALIVFLPITIIISKKIKHFGIVCISVSSIIGLSIFCIYTYVKVEPNKEYDNKTALVSAMVLREEKHTDGKYSLNIKTEKIDNEATSVNAVLYTNVPIEVIYGEKIEFEAKINFADRQYQQTKGIFLLMDGYGKFTYRVLSKGNTLKYFPQRLCYHLSKAVFENMDEEPSGVCAALSFGNSSRLSAKLKQYFKRAGLLHYLVVSGLHMSVIYSAGEFIFSSLFRRKKQIYLCSVFLILFYMFMTGFLFSVSRSGFMLIAMLLIKIIRYDSDSLNNMGTALIIIFIGNPYSMANVGLLLSVFSTLGVIAAWQPLDKIILPKISKNNVAVRYLVMQSGCFAAAVGASLPMYMIWFKCLSVVGIFGSIVLIPVLELLLYLTLFGSLINIVGAVYIGRLMFRLCEIMADMVIYCAEAVGSIPHGTVYVKGIYFIAWLSVTAVIFYCFYKFSVDNKRRMIKAAACSCITAIVLLAFSLIYSYNKTVVKVIDGQMVTVRKNGGTIIIPLTGIIDEDVIYECDDQFDRFTVLSADQTMIEYDNVKNMTDLIDFSRILLFGSTDENYSVPVSSFEKDKCFVIEDVKINYLVADGKKYTYLQSGDGSLLIMPQKGDCSKLNCSWLKPDAVITGNDLKNSGELSCGLAIIINGEKNDTLEINSRSVYNTESGEIFFRLEDLHK